MSVGIGDRLRALVKDALDRLEIWRHGVPLECVDAGDPKELAARPSPRVALRFPVGDQEALICYGAPSLRRRRIFGDLVPWGQLWRTGANEPTRLHLPVALSIVPVERCDPVEQLAFRAEVVDEGRTDLMLEWERMRLRIPLVRR